MPAKKKDQVKKKREFTLDIFEILRRADKNDLAYYDSLSEDEKKAIAPLVLMRWMSAVSSNNNNVEHHITAVNNIVNVGFFDLARYPDLQWKLLAACGSGISQKHEWIKGPAKLTTTKFDNLILGLYPSLNDMELELVKRKFSYDGLKQLCRELAMEDHDIKPIIEEFKKYQERQKSRD